MRTFLFISMTLLLATSCKKDSEEAAPDPAPTIPVQSYMPLDVGNYWLYERYNVQSDGTESFSAVDTMTIVGDTLINGYTYAIREFETFSGNQVAYLRDSLNYIVNSDGTIRFSNTDFNNELAFYESEPPEPHYTLSTFMNSDIVEQTVPAGTFDCLQAVTEIQTNDTSFAAVFPKYNLELFSEGVGMVYKRSNYYTGTAYVEFRLLDYHVQ